MAYIHHEQIAALGRLWDRFPGAVFEVEDYFPDEQTIQAKGGEPKGWLPLLVTFHVGQGAERRYHTALIKIDGALHVADGLCSFDDPALRQFTREAWEDSYRDGTLKAQ